MSDLPQLVADMMAAGRIASDEAAIILKFNDFLTKWGPLRGPLTSEQEAFRRHVRTDAEWCEFLGCPR